jgi:hypothetical protein
MKWATISCLLLGLLLVGCGGDGEDAVEGSGILTGTWTGLYKYQKPAWSYEPNPPPDQEKTLVLIHTGTDVEGTYGPYWVSGTYDPETRILDLDWGTSSDRSKHGGVIRFHLEADNNTLIMTAYGMMMDSGGLYWFRGTYNHTYSMTMTRQ